MRYLGLVVLVLLAAVPVFADAPVCTTTLEIDTCGQQPVEGRKVKIQVLDGDTIKKKTDEEGQITLGLCQEKISEVKISGADSRRISRTAVTDATETEVKTTIAFNICGA